MTLSIPHYENFIACQREGEGGQDYKLTRFACHLTVMNADVRKEAVAAAQIYFIEQARRMEFQYHNHEEIDRMLIRDEVKEGNKSLQSVAKDAGVEDFAKFNNAGYLGLYNQYNWQLASKRKISKDKLFDYMGRTELAANLFRITQTEERIKSKDVKGQVNLEQAHFDVGKEVRQFVHKNTGKNPEQLPMERKLPDLQKELRTVNKKMKELDAPKTKKLKKLTGTINPNRVDTLNITVIETQADQGLEWGISLDGFNPNPSDYFKMPDSDTAFRIKEILDSLVLAVHAPVTRDEPVG